MVIKKQAPHILSVACGYLRELTFSFYFKKGKIGRFVALDQDKQTLNTVKEEFCNYNIEIIKSSIMVILKNRIKGKFDLVYSSGLYDYLTF